jgi:CheY-like chemotaxis protein
VEAALRQAQKLEAIGQLTGGVAHDFNNLLTVIRSSADLLRRPGLSEERRRRYIEAIRETVDRAAKVTGQLLAFARRQALQPEVFDAAERVRGVMDMLRSLLGSRVRLCVEDGCGDCLVEADPAQFEAALVNMAVNARDAMDGEGRLTVRVAEVAALPPIRGHAGGGGAFVAVSLTDTGHGIPPERLAQIFEPFFTTKEVGRGTGLGLSQVYGFAKQSKGDVAVDSRVGEGTTFTLYLPRVADGAAAAGGDAAALAQPQVAPEGGQGLRVLVVEDNADVGAFSSQVLRDLGYGTEWVASGADALARLSAGGADDFDAVFTDVVMPGMTGIELGEVIRGRYPRLHVVLTSGYSHVLAEEGRHGFELLQKPYSADDLSRVLRRRARR